MHIKILSWGELFPKNHRTRVSLIRSIILRLTKNGLSWEMALVYVVGHKIVMEVLHGQCRNWTNPDTNNYLPCNYLGTRAPDQAQLLLELSITVQWSSSLSVCLSASSLCPQATQRNAMAVVLCPIKSSLNQPAGSKIRGNGTEKKRQSCKTQSLESYKPWVL